MKVEIKIPRMGESISEVTIGTIMKPSGSQVNQDDEILELETDKVNQVLYAPQAGVVTLNVKSEDVVKIDQVVGSVDTEAKAAASPAPKTEQPQAPQQAPKAETAPASEEKRAPVAATKAGESGQIRKTKSAFISELSAREQTPVQESKTVEKPIAAKSKPKAAEPAEEQKTDYSETRKKMSKIRKVIAARMVEAQHTTAMLTTFNEVDMTEIMSLREKYKESFIKEYGVKLGLMSFFVKACVSALRAFPDFNSYIDGDDIVHREYFNIGVAVGTEKGVVVPVIRDCDQRSFAGIESALEKMAVKSREGALAIADLEGGGFTITNGGIYGSLLSTPIINPPQCGILGMHKIMKRAVVIDDQIVIRPMMNLALSYDHRIVDGKEAVSFLVHIKTRLEDPSRLLLES